MSIHSLAPGILIIVLSSISSGVGCSSVENPPDASIPDAAIPDAAPDAMIPDAMPPDAMPPDAMPPDAAPCVGHACPGEPSIVQLPEGGIMRVEYLHVGNQPDGTRIEAPLRAFVIQFEGQASYDPASGDDIPRPYLGPVVADSGTMSCFDQTANDLSFTIYHPNIQNFVDSRTYYNNGPPAMTMAATGGPNDGLTVDLIRIENAADPHDGVLHDNLWLGFGPASELARAAKHSVSDQLANGDYPGLAAATGYDLPGGGVEWSGTMGAFLAPDFRLDSPTEAEFFGGLPINPNLDLPMGYTLLNSATIPSDWPTPLWYAGFISLQDYGDGAGTKPTLQYLCLGPAGYANSNSNLVIPAAVFQEPGFPAAGKFLTGLLTHTAWALHETHRFDAVGLNAAIGDYWLAP